MNLVPVAAIFSLLGSVLVISVQSRSIVSDLLYASHTIFVSISSGSKVDNSSNPIAPKIVATNPLSLIVPISNCLSYLIPRALYYEKKSSALNKSQSSYNFKLSNPFPGSKRHVISQLRRRPGLLHKSRRNRRRTDAEDRQSLER